MLHFCLKISVWGKFANIVFPVDLGFRSVTVFLGDCVG
uniref:Uncharacterized protein n=1 Tax=Anguilla anguilla TaxID=7936 RepID=A0A0E9R300_ANGAN